MTEPMREGLPPVVGDDARVLILGSFPSERSLVAGEYYANRRNQFWQLMAALYDVDPDLPYEQRIAALTGHGVALWDVVHSCRRAGSLDAKIDRATLVVNDFGPLWHRHPGIGRIFVNGLTAFELFTAGAHRAARRPVAVQQRRAADVVRGQAGQVARGGLTVTPAQTPTGV